jgi:hypothetical protein
VSKTKKIDEGALSNYMRSIPRDVKHIIHRGTEDLTGTEVVYVLNGVEVKKVFPWTRKLKT